MWATPSCMDNFYGDGYDDPGKGVGVHVINPTTTTSSIRSSRNPCQSATFSIVVKPPLLPVQGFVRLRSGSLTLGTLELSNGRASWVTTALPAGQNTVTATYVPPNGNYLASSASLTQRVQEDGIGSIAVL